MNHRHSRLKSKKSSTRYRRRRMLTLLWFHINMHWRVSQVYPRFLLSTTIRRNTRNYSLCWKKWDAFHHCRLHRTRTYSQLLVLMLSTHRCIWTILSDSQSCSNSRNETRSLQWWTTCIRIIVEHELTPEAQLKLKNSLTHWRKRANHVVKRRFSEKWRNRHHYQRRNRTAQAKARKRRSRIHRKRNNSRKTLKQHPQ